MPKYLLNILNSLHPNIKFTMETSETNIPFLDILVNKKENKLWMDLYTKPTDSKRYVPFHSCHPRHCLENIPYCLARRICMIVENDEEKQNKLNDLKSTLEKQNYPNGIIEKAIIKASNIPQKNLRKEKVKDNNKILPFITTNNPNNPNIFRTVQTSLEVIKSSKGENSKIIGYNLINSKRQPPSLERLLCKTNYITEEKIKVSKCGKNCVCCPYILECKEIRFKNREMPFKLRSAFNCESSNLLYVIKCKGCNEEYIGQTSRTLKERIVLYRQHINDKDYEQMYVEKHLRTCGNKEFFICPFFQLKSKETLNREAHEQAFISQLKPSLNRRIEQ